MKKGSKMTLGQREKMSKGHLKGRESNKRKFNCKVCNKEVIDYPHNRKRYCSVNCRNEDWTGKNNPNFNHKWDIEKRAEASKRLLNQYEKGKVVWNKGLTKEDIRVFNNTKFFRENNPAKLEETKLKISKANKGKLMGDLNPAKREENRIKITLGLKKAFKEGRKDSSMTKNPMWKGGLSFEPYTTDWTNALRKIIRKRDNYSCQLCFKEGNQIHHINYDKKDCNPQNLITLCESCHSKTNANREKWKKILQDKQIYKV